MTRSYRSGSGNQDSSGAEVPLSWESGRKSKIGKMGIRIRWYAYKPEDLEQRVYNQKEQKGCIMIQPDTMVLPPKGSIHMQPVFINMKEDGIELYAAGSGGR